jgi:hypothetical protein
MGSLNKYLINGIDALRGAAHFQLARYLFNTRSKALEQIDLCFWFRKPGKKRNPGFAKWKQAEREAKEAASNASEPVQDTKPDAVTPAPPEPPAEQPFFTVSSKPIDQHRSTFVTAGISPEMPAQPKSRGHVKGDKHNTSQGTAAAK